MHMNLKKYATLLLAASLTLSSFCGCAATKADSQQLPLKTAVYSNLTDEESRSLLRQGLSDAGVRENRIDTLFAKVDAFRADVKSEWLTKGFESAAPTETKYDPYEMQDAWMKKTAAFPDIIVESQPSVYLVTLSQRELISRIPKARMRFFWILKRFLRIPLFSAETVPPNSVLCSHL